MNDCTYCGKEIEHVDCCHPWLHNKCYNEWDRRKDAGLCVMCGEPLPEGHSVSELGSRHQSCGMNSPWIGYDSL